MRGMGPGGGGGVNGNCNNMASPNGPSGYWNGVCTAVNRHRPPRNVVGGNVAYHWWGSPVLLGKWRSREGLASSHVTAARYMRQAVRGAVERSTVVACRYRYIVTGIVQVEDGRTPGEEVLCYSVK